MGNITSVSRGAAVRFSARTVVVLLLIFDNLNGMDGFGAFLIPCSFHSSHCEFITAFALHAIQSEHLQTAIVHCQNLRNHGVVFQDTVMQTQQKFPGLNSSA